MATLREVNKEIKQRFGPYKLIKARSYYRLLGLTEEADLHLGRLKETGLYAYDITPLTVEQVINEVKNLLKQ